MNQFVRLFISLDPRSLYMIMHILQLQQWDLNKCTRLSCQNQPCLVVCADLYVLIHLGILAFVTLRWAKKYN